MFPLDSYRSELDEDSVSDGLQAGGRKRETVSCGQVGTLTFRPETQDCAERLTLGCPFPRHHSDAL
jgi:hypothetical protein